VKYALIAYNDGEIEQRGPMKPEIAEVLAGPHVTGWVRLQHADSATTLSTRDGKTLLTDGPFVDSKEYLGGFIIVEAANLDEALAIATEFHRMMAVGGALEVRPILEDG